MSIFSDIQTIAREKGHRVILAEHILLALLGNDEATEILVRIDPSLDVKSAKKLLESLIAEYPRQNCAKGFTNGTTSLKIRELSERMCDDINHISILDFMIVVFSVLRKEIEAGERSPESFEYLHIPQNEIKLSQMFRGEVVPLDGADEKARKFTEGNLLCDEMIGLPFDFEFVGKKKELEQLTNYVVGDTGITVVVGEEGSGKSTLIRRAISGIKGGGGEPLLMAGTNFLTCKLSKMASFELNARINLLISTALEHDSVLVLENLHKIKPFLDNSALSSTLLAAAENGLKIVLSMTDSCFESTFGKVKGLRSVARVNIRDHTLAELKAVSQCIAHELMEKRGGGIHIYDLEEFTELVFEKTKSERLFNLSSSIGYALTNAAIEERSEVRGADLRLALSRITLLDESKLTHNVESSMTQIEQKIEKSIYGQSDAISEIARGARLAALGLKENESAPPAIFMMLGPTGVGKTETTYEFAKALGKEVVRLDMSEYQESHTLSKLLGSPSGYVGYDKGDGALLDQLKKKPDAIVLFDEIEKAHPQIHQLMLGLMDYGTLTTSTNKVVDLSKNYIFFTSNVGIDTKEAGGHFGLAANAHSEAAQDKIVEFKESVYERKFTPEFRARIDRKIIFNPLDRDVAKLVVKKSEDSFSEKLKSKFNIGINLGEEVVDHVVEGHFGAADGARRLKSGFEVEVISPVTEFIMKEGVSAIDSVYVSLEQGAVVVKG